MGNERSSPTVEQEQELFQSSIGFGPAGANKRLLARLLAVIEGFWMQSIGETEILIEATVVGKVRVQKVSALAALHPRIGLVAGVDLNPIDGSLHSGKARPDEYWLTELRGNLYLSENGPSIGSVHWIGAHCEIRSQPYPSESQLQLACDLDPGTLERLEDVIQRGLDTVIRDIIVADQAQDCGIKRSDVSFPYRKRALSILGGLHRHLGEGPRLSVVRHIFYKLREISADAGAHSSKQRHHELNKSALHLSSAHIGDERFPVVPPFSNFVEHREEHDALHVDIGPTGSTSNVPELRNLDALAVAVQRVHN